MSAVSSEQGVVPLVPAKMSYAKGQSEVSMPERARAAFRTGKKLSKQEVVEEPYDSGLCLQIGNEGKEVTPSENRSFERTERVESSSANRGVPPRSMSSRPKLLVRSQALCGEDDTQYTLRFSSLPLGSTTRSSASSLSVGSSQDVYTDSTGIDLQSFIVNTLHKNMKDRQMLLQLEQQMTHLINDSSRNSQKFPVMSSYNRMLVHRVAAFFGLDHNVDQSGTAVVVNKNSQTRIPNLNFSSLIRSDTFTDEPRKYLKRSVQSYEEGRQCLGSDLMSGRRAHSFDGEYAAGNAMPGNCQLPVNPVQMNMYSLPGSNSSSDITAPQLLESPGSGYSYGDIQPMRPPLENSTIYGGYPLPQVYQWSCSDNYGNYNPATELPPSIITSPVPSSSRAPMLGATRNMKKAASLDTERSLHSNGGSQMAGDQRTAPLRRSMTDRHRPDLLSVREPSIPEHATVPSSGPESIPVPSWQSPIYDGARVEPSSSNQYFIGPQCPPTQQYVQCVQPSIPNTRPDLHCVTQQIDALCVSDQAEVTSPQIYTYHLPPQCANPPFPPQQVQLSGSMCQTQPYYVSVLPQGYVMTNAQQPPICRYGALPAAYQNNDYSSVSYVNCSEMQQPGAKSVETVVPTSAVEQL